MDTAYLVPTRQGTTVVPFAGLVELAAGDANTILEGLQLNLDSNHLPPGCVGSLGTDGASPLMGRHNGVQVQFQRSTTHA